MRAQMTPRISTVLDDANLSHDALVKGSELIAVSSMRYQGGHEVVNMILHG